MNTKITIDNYEEIMFRLVEDDFDELTRNHLLAQIEENVLFKFEWEQWQKTRCIDPVENYSDESPALTKKIILIARPQIFSGRRKMFYLTAAAIAALFAGVLLLTAIFNTRQEQVVESIGKTPVHENFNPLQSQNTHEDNAQKDLKQPVKPERPEEVLRIAAATNTPEMTEIVGGEVPVLLDSISVYESNTILAVVQQKKPRYSVTIETTQLLESNNQMSEIAQNERVKLTKVFTNTKILFRRKPNGEPDKIILLGEDESYLCINLNQTIK
ncbi:MAG: hypothetical protein CVT94_04280 [Bacteroidetes bacterium HGW-Bacteroidetes-11]|jgi:cell division protein FtsL|nr:MAG: hypothetical protein CVT94_04280 [Bacteroidetes bacterium HGW-Bacteroidetes-11]